MQLFFWMERIFHFLLLCCNSHFYAARNEIRRVHKNEQIDQNCAIDYWIQLNGSNKPTMDDKNLLRVKSILDFIQWYVGYKMSSLISIGRLCIIADWQKEERTIYFRGQSFVSLPVPLSSISAMITLSDELATCSFFSLR